MSKWTRAALGAMFLLFSEFASAHGYVRGVGNFYAGLLHPLFAPPHLMALIALGMLIGQRGLRVGRDAMLAFLLALLAGLLTSDVLGNPDTDGIVLAFAALLGIAVAIAHPAVSAGLLALAAALSGFAIGIGSAPEQLAGKAWWIMAGGTVLGCFACINLFLMITESLKRDWMRIGVRVLGSWITASALLVLTLSMVPHTKSSELSASTSAAHTRSAP